MLMKTPDYNRMSPAAAEKRRRMRLLIAAYAYEVLNVTVMTDAEFDRECRAVDLRVATDRPDLDQWFITHFDPSTGMWIHRLSQADLERIKQLALIVGADQLGWEDL